jgi:hypothetical protein
MSNKIILLGLWLSLHYKDQPVTADYEYNRCLCLPSLTNTKHRTPCTLNRGAHFQVAKSPWQLSFLWWRLIFFNVHFGTRGMSTFWPLELLCVSYISGKVLHPCDKIKSFWMLPNDITSLSCTPPPWFHCRQDLKPCILPDLYLYIERK